MDILTQAQEDELIKKHRSLEGKGHRSGKWVVRLYVHIWKVKKKTPLDKEFRRMIEGCGTRGRGKNIKECAKSMRFTIDNFDLEGNEIFKAKQDEERKARKQLEEDVGSVETEAEDNETEDEDDETEGEDDGTEEEIEGGSGKRSEEEKGRIDSRSDQYYEEDGSLATNESEKKNSNDGSGQEETNEEQVDDENTNGDDANDEDASSAEADDQNQAIDKQSLQPKKRGRRSPGESSRSSSGGAVEVERSGMSELALKQHMKSPKKKQKTGDEQDAELDVEQEARENSGL
ncbi:hypothetical protein BCON_0406g00010 [Botryotinia convoluta]|uniref:Uncharacterized protein n=1 Tax=Botryotinia convoluta TaxID=54673 RepID=A0A4Z1HCX6_9HELO|nr:hypothetical protein BCON_0406g00010 [Botryotinia convoluta]